MLNLKKQSKLRHAEYYDLTDTFDRLYADSKNNMFFTNLMDIITCEENIKLAYRNIKKNSGSKTAGVDERTIIDIENLQPEKLVEMVRKNLAYYKPRPVKRVEIPKPNGKTRPLGIPTILDRLIQQCILQVMEPICEAKFYERSNGFRPNRSTENAIAQCYKMIQQMHLFYVVDVDIKGFFDNVNHAKLKKQIWNMGIRDKKLISIISEMLKAPIILPNGERIIPDKGTPQGGILSPLLSNIVLNELDWWVASQWENMKTRHDYKCPVHSTGTPNKGPIYTALRKTNLKEMYLVRYADDFKIFCRNREDAEKVLIATKLWLKDRLHLEISEEKSKIVNLKKHYSEFLGFKLKTTRKRNTYVVKSHMNDKAVNLTFEKLKELIRKMQKPDYKDVVYYIYRYNVVVIGVHNYYKIATNINIDCSKIAYRLQGTIKDRIGEWLKKDEILENGYIKKHYGNSKQLRFLAGKPLVPIAYIQTKNPMFKKSSINKYTPDGRIEIHKDLGVNMHILHQLMRYPEVNRSIEYMDNRISLYSAQNGKCAITGRVLEIYEIHCHHKVPVMLGGDDSYKNLIIVHNDVHMLIHATKNETLDKYLKLINPDKNMLNKINKLRLMAQLETITVS